MLGTKDSERGWFPSNYVDPVPDPLYCKPEYTPQDTAIDPVLDLVTTLYPFNSESAEELAFAKDEQWVVHAGCGVQAPVLPCCW